MQILLCISGFEEGLTNKQSNIEDHSSCFGQEVPSPYLVNYSTLKDNERNN